MSNQPYLDSHGNETSVLSILLPDGEWYHLKEGSFSVFWDCVPNRETGKPFPGTEALWFACTTEEGKSLTAPYASIKAMVTE
jgi:hypothetical protein